MNITVGKFVLRSDNMNYWMEKDGVRVSGYFPHFEDLYTDFIERRFRGSDKEKMEDVLKELNTALKDAKKMVREYAKEKNK